MQGLSRTNYFAVTNAALFLAVMNRYNDVKVSTKEEDGSTLYAVTSISEDGTFPSHFKFDAGVEGFLLEFINHGDHPNLDAEQGFLGFMSEKALDRGLKIEDFEEEFIVQSFRDSDVEWLEVDFIELMGKFVAHGEILVSTVTSHEKGRSNCAYAVAIRGGDLKQVEVNIESIYQLAEEQLGKTPSRAEL